MAKLPIPRRDDLVPDDERRSAAFIAGYEALCKQHNAMLIMAADEEAQYDYFVVVLIEGDDEMPVLEQALEEMRLKSPVYMNQFGDMDEEEDVEDEEEDEPWKG